MDAEEESRDRKKRTTT